MHNQETVDISITSLCNKLIYSILYYKPERIMYKVQTNKQSNKNKKPQERGNCKRARQSFLSKKCEGYQLEVCETVGP